ncbi:MAG: nucleotidyltransferase family protein [Nitrolancea sp.]
MSCIAAAILAAGTSSRLGTPKQLLDLGGRPVLAHTLDAVRRSRVDLILVTLGNEQARIEASVDLTDTIVVPNPDYAEGQSTSVVAVIRALPKDVDAILFVLGDQPFQEPAVIDAIIDSYRSDGAAIAQPRYSEGRGNPILITRQFFSELLDLTGDVGARPILERHRDQITLVDVSNFSRPGDIDTFDDFDSIQQQYRQRQDAP